MLGHGGMAEVRKGRDLRLERPVAMKMLRSDLARDPHSRRDSVARRSRPRHSTRLRWSRCTTPVKTPSNGARVPYIVMEYVEGQTLRDLLRNGERLMPTRALEITDGVLAALEYSHRNGIIHRDVKPAQCHARPTSGQVKVMDFGIARAVADSGATMTQTANVLGTAQYLSPEQARGEVVDARSDLYSTGCLLYELLDQPTTVPRGVAGCGGLPARSREPNTAFDDQPRCHACDGCHRHEGAGQESGQPVPVSGRDAF